ncbi:MAG: DUF6036 family nucleotidyltransferase [Bacteroidota bacterium]
METHKLSATEETLSTIDGLCKKNNLAYVIIGGLANLVYGSGRTTIDIDIVVRVELESILELYDCFLPEFMPIKPEPLQFFKTFFVLPVVHKKLGVKVDISAALSEFERVAIQRQKRLQYGEVEANFCTPEDLILFKLVARRERDMLDVKDIIKRLSNSMDLEYLRATASQFIEIDRSDILENLNKLL